MKAPVTRPAMRLLARVVVRLLTRTVVSGQEHLPRSGPLLIVINHLGHLDAPVLIAALPYSPEAIALSDLFHVPVTGQLLRLYGVIPVHRDVFDRTVVQTALSVLCQGKVLILAPEARMSVTGALETARGGAAYLALKSRAPILPVALTGTANARFYGEWKRLHRPRVTVAIGEPFALPDLPTRGAVRRRSLAEASTIIMTRLAELLPAEYRGVYGTQVAEQPSEPLRQVRK